MSKNNLLERLRQNKEGGSAESGSASTAADSEAAAMAARSAESMRDPDAMILPLAAIVVPDDLLRDVDEAHAEELADSIAAEGQHQPIIVDDLGNGQYQLVAGLHRYTAKTILAQLDPMNLDNHNVRATRKGSAAALLIGYRENVDRKDFTPSEEAAALQRLQKHFDCSQKELAEHIKKSPGYVSKYLELNDADSEIKAAIDAGELALSRWYSNRGKSLSEMMGQTAESGSELSPHVDAFLSDEGSEEAAEVGEGAESPAKEKPAKAKAKKKGAKPEQRLALPLSAGERMARMLATLAERYGLPAVDLKSRATKADILAVLTTRLDDIAEAVEGDEGG